MPVGRSRGFVCEFVLKSLMCGDCNLLSSSWESVKHTPGLQTQTQQMTTQSRDGEYDTNQRNTAVFWDIIFLVER